MAIAETRIEWADLDGSTLHSYSAVIDGEKVSIEDKGGDGTIDKGNHSRPYG